MTAEQLGGTLRSLLMLGAGWAAAFGMSGETYVAASGGVVAVATWAWSMWSKKKAAEAVTKAAVTGVDSGK